jgi:hypothetical protein
MHWSLSVVVVPRVADEGFLRPPKARHPLSLSTPLYIGSNPPFEALLLLARLGVDPFL